VEGGNGLVWSGTMPFQHTLDDNGIVALNVNAAEAFFGVPGSSLVLGSGQQNPTALAASVLPSLAIFATQRALRYDQLRAPWSVARIFAEDADRDSDAIELLHSARRGFYAQFLCDDRPLTRPAVLTEYLGTKLMHAKLGTPGAQRR
jgi:hypothetical protein